VGRRSQASLILFVYKHVGVQVRLWNSSTTRAIPKRFCDEVLPRRGAIWRVLYLYLPQLRPCSDSGDYTVNTVTAACVILSVAAGAAVVNTELRRLQSAVSTGSRYQPGYSADGVVPVVERVERIGERRHRIDYWYYIRALSPTL